MILIIDNYDSFVHNLARYLQQTGEQTHIVRNDQITIEQITALTPTAIILSPGPCTPDKAGICIDIVKQLGATTPILGVCLGHQAIAQSYGGTTIRAPKPVHGQSSRITHNDKGLFSALPNPLTVGRYHSLISDLTNAPDLIQTATTDSGTLMAMRHKTHPIYGVQFHPESILTENGLAMIQKFVTMAHEFHLEKR